MQNSQINWPWLLQFSDIEPEISKNLNPHEQHILSMTCSSLRASYLSRLKNHPKQLAYHINNLTEVFQNESDLIEALTKLSLNDQPVFLEANPSIIKKAQIVASHIHVQKLIYTFECPRPKKFNKITSTLPITSNAVGGIIAPLFKDCAVSLYKRQLNFPYSNAAERKIPLKELIIRQSYSLDEKLNSLIKKIDSRCKQLEIIISSNFKKSNHESLFFPMKDIHNCTQLEELIIKSERPIIYPNSFENFTNLKSLRFDHPWLRIQPDYEGTTDGTIAALCAIACPSLLPSLPVSLLNLSIVDCSKTQLNEIAATCNQLQLLRLIDPQETVFDGYEKSQIQKLEIYDVVSLDLSIIFKAFPKLESLYIQEHKEGQLNYQALGSSKTVKTITIEPKGLVDSNTLRGLANDCPNAEIFVNFQSF